MESSSARLDQDGLYKDAVDCYGPVLGRLARGYEADPEKRRDLLQEIHLQLWRSFGHFDARCSIRTWIYRVAHNCARSHVTRESRVYSRLVDLGQLDEAAERKEDTAIAVQRQNALDRLTSLIQQLKPTDRQVILLYLEGTRRGFDWGSHRNFRRPCGRKDWPHQKHFSALVS